MALKVRVDVANKRGEWVALATFTGAVTAEVKGSGVTVAAALRTLGEAVEIYFDHIPERDAG